MSIEEVIRKGPETAHELLRKLTDTTDGAVKTRQKLLAQLRKEIELLTRRKEEHLFPALEQHRETKRLVNAAREGSKKVNELLSELEGMEVTNEDFSGKVTELRRTFQAEIQNERKEAIPAIKKVLGADEAREIAERILKAAEEGVEQMREGAEQVSATAGQVGEAFATAGEAMAAAGEVAADATARTASSAARGATEAAESFFPAGTAFMPEVARDLAGRPVKAMREVALAWLEFVNATRSSSLRLAGELSTATTPMKWAAVSTRAGSEMASAWIAAGSRIMAASTSLSSEPTGRSDRQRR